MLIKNTFHGLYFPLCAVDAVKHISFGGRAATVDFTSKRILLHFQLFYSSFAVTKNLHIASKRIYYVM